jgi:putative MATE family efflux protein
LAQDLTQGPVGGHLRRQATPMAMGLIAIISFDAVDLLFVAQLGAAQLAAMSFCFPAIWLLTSVNIGFEAGAASTISRSIGGGDTSGARRLTTDTALLAGLTSVGLALLGLLTITKVFPLLGAGEELLPLIADYMGIWYLAMPAAAVYWVCLASMRARGNTMLEGKVIALAALLNLILDPILIFGLFGMPRLEMAGAALATLLSNVTVMIGTLVYLHFRLGVLATLKVPVAVVFASWRRVLRIGLPATLTNTIVPLSNSVIVTLVAQYGAPAVAGLGIAMRIEPVALIAFYALSAVTSPIIGQNFGAGIYHRLELVRGLIGRFALMFGLVLAAILALVGEGVSRLFTDSDASLLVSSSYLMIMPLSYGGYGMVMCACAAFNGLDLPGRAVLLSALRAIFVLLPLAWLGQHFFGLSGLFVGAAGANIIVGISGYIWLGRTIRSVTEQSGAQ